MEAPDTCHVPLLASTYCFLGPTLKEANGNAYTQMPEAISLLCPTCCRMTGSMTSADTWTPRPSLARHTPQNLQITPLHSPDTVCRALVHTPSSSPPDMLLPKPLDSVMHWHPTCCARECALSLRPLMTFWYSTVSRPRRSTCCARVRTHPSSSHYVL